MKRGFYFRLAITGISKNRKLYFPYILTCICMVMMRYIIGFLARSETFAMMSGGQVIQEFLKMGTGVITIFALIFLYYTNSFLIKKRQKEFGLYHILGMDKKSLIKIVVCENAVITVCALAGGFGLGILLSKAAELLLFRLIEGLVQVHMKVDVTVMGDTTVLFLAIFALVMMRMIVSILRSRPVEMLRSENVGEKPPKANWILAIAGAILLGIAYYIAVTIEDPMAAIMMFFVAVTLVILATYLLFIAGSVTLCRALQRNKNYYYKTKHFVSVSSMVYRMKRNGAGLASICILSTMALVMLSSVTCLWLGMEDSMRGRYPRDIMTNIESSDVFEESGRSEELVGIVQKILDEHETKQKNVLDYRRLLSSGYQKDSEILFDLDYMEQQTNLMTNVRQVYVIPLEEYNRLTGNEETLAENEVLISQTKKKGGYKYDTITLQDCGTWNVKKQVDFLEDGTEVSSVFGSIVLVVPQKETLNVIRDTVNHYVSLYASLSENQRVSYDELDRVYGFDLDCTDEEQIEIYKEILTAVEAYNAEHPDAPIYAQMDSQAWNRADFVSLYGGLFFLGIFLGIVMIFGMVLIMYYKQISEGYEDQNRFDILMKVGMTEKEVRQSINSQVLMVFFLPLVTAGIHTAFSFPILNRVLSLLLLGVTSKWFLMGVMAATFAVFGVFYVVVYLITSRSYYGIVKNNKNL